MSLATLPALALLSPVKNLTIHNVVYNCCRLQDTWVER